MRDNLESNILTPYLKTNEDGIRVAAIQEILSDPQNILLTSTHKRQDLKGSNRSGWCLSSSGLPVLHPP